MKMRCPLDYKLISEVLFAIIILNVTSVFLLTSVFLCWCQQKSFIRDKWWTSNRRKVADPSNQSSHKAASKKWTKIDPSWTFVADVSNSLEKKWKMTSRDVTWRHHVGFLPTFQKMFLLLILWLCPNMKSFASFKRKLWTITFFQVNMEIYRKILPTPDKKPISSDQNMTRTWNLQEMCKTKFHIMSHIYLNGFDRCRFFWGWG